MEITTPREVELATIGFRNNSFIIMLLGAPMPLSLPIKKEALVELLATLKNMEDCGLFDSIQDDGG